MKFFLTLYSVFIVLFCISCSSEDSLVIENQKFAKTFYFNKNKPGSINVEFSKNSNSAKLNNSSGFPFFEFVINDQLVSSESKFWVFQSHSIREMGNGGKEHSLIFKGEKNPVNGLRLVLYQQIFPYSTLIREKLVLESDTESFELNKLDGKLHFKFPAYSLRNKEEEVKSTEIKIASWENKPITFGNRRKGNHMYYPEINESVVLGEGQTVKGPISIISNGEISWIIAYEHASQDNLNGLLNKRKLGSGNQINDAMQGTRGVFNFPLNEDDFKFLGISSNRLNNNINVSVDILRGGYLDGEIINKNNSYSTVWTATGFYEGEELEEGKAMLRHYLFNQICEKKASREPEYYYNTWGLQRQDNKKPLRGILTYERIFEEIEYAAALGVDIFVLDDGWENAQGEWFPNSERLTEGLAPIKKKLDEHGIKMGLWYSPMGIDSTSRRYKKYSDWVIKDSENKPILAQWNHPAFDFVSGFFDVFIKECKEMIDEGCLFMKWDAINTFYSSLPNLDHGSDKYSKEEIRARYEYLLPIYVVKAMEILTNYKPELVIEIDLTEARRVMVGLAPLSQGKLFWMNNGASWYNDYTAFRTQSMRTIANEFAGIIPLELFTYANYPHNVEGKMKYNVHNSILAGHGFWGNLQLMNSKDRKWVGKQVNLSKRILPYLVDENPVITGKVGDSPEVYSVVNSEKAAGQIVLFSENPVKYEFKGKVNSKELLAVLNHSFSVIDNQLNLVFSLTEQQESEAVFVLPNNNEGVTMVSSTSVISDAVLQNGTFEYVTAAGQQIILWNKNNGDPVVATASGIEAEVVEKDNHFEIKVAVNMDDTRVIISKQ